MFGMLVMLARNNVWNSQHIWIMKRYPLYLNIRGLSQKNFGDIKSFNDFFFVHFFSEMFCVCVLMKLHVIFFSHNWRCFEKNGCDKHLGVCLCCQRSTNSFNVTLVLVWEKWFLQTECIKILQLYSENDILMFTK